MYKTLIKKITRRFSKYVKEKNRIGQIQRYTGGKTSLLGANISFVDSVSFLNGLEEIFEEECYKFKTQNPTPKIIDCGSNIGLGIMYFKKLYPECSIEAFEPDPEIFKVLSENVNSLQYKDIKLHNKAVWNMDKKVAFRQEGGFSGRIPIKGDQSDLAVEGVRLSTFINETIDLLKIDIEGAEIDVLYEIESKLNLVDRIFIEYHSPSNEKQRFDELINILKRNKYRYYIKEAFVPKNPFFEVEVLDDMDLQLNVYGIRK